MQARQAVLCTTPLSTQPTEIQAGLTPPHFPKVETIPSRGCQPRATEATTRKHDPGLKILKDMDDLSLEDFGLDLDHPLCVLESILEDDDEDLDLFGEEFERMREKMLEFVTRLALRTISQKGMILAIVTSKDDLEWTSLIEEQVTDLKCSIEADVEILKFELMEHQRQRSGVDGDAKIDLRKEVNNLFRTQRKQIMQDIKRLTGMVKEQVNFLDDLTTL